MKFNVMTMVYDYYEILKRRIDSDEYTEVSDIVRQDLWSDGFEFKMSKEWLIIENLIRISLYLFLRYS